MESGQVDKRKVAGAAALAVTLFLWISLFIGRPTAVAKPLGVRQVQDCTVICSTCNPVEYRCDQSGGGGGYATPPGSGGGPTSVPPGGGSTPQPGATQRPFPTVIPPTGAPPSGYYTTLCTDAGFGNCSCSQQNYANITVYIAPSGDIYVISCNCVSYCVPPVTVTPPPPGPTPPPPYPCNQPPQPGDGTITQPCTGQWPGYNLSVSVRIPPVNMARNPWPRSLVGLATQMCFISAPTDEEQFSAPKAVPCGSASGESDEPTWHCGGTTGDVGEGAQVNYQLGVAWRRFTGGDPGYGTVPPFRSALELEDRDWNGGSKLIMLDPGQCTSHTYETASYGLDTTGEVWNPACQDRECSYTERTLPVNRSCEACEACTCADCYPAYDAFIQTWWWPEWTWRYDQYVCVQEESHCEVDPTGQHSCGGQAGMRTVRECVRWGWRNVIEPWRLYDVRRQGLPLPYLGSSLTNAAGMTPEHQVMTPFQYSPSVPVIEIQPVK